MSRNKKIKVFLGGYVNSQNAQNNNCRSLSEQLDKTKFEVWTMRTWHSYPKNNDFVETPGVHYIYDTPAPLTEKFHLPYWLFAWIAYAIGIMKCNVAFLPKGEYVKFCHFVAKLSGCKLFTTIEGILDETLLSQVKKSITEITYQYNSFFPHLYSITKYIQNKEHRDKGIKCNEKILYLGVNSEIFINNATKQEKLTNIVFIGFSLIRKSASEFIKIATEFPDIKFHIVGGNTLEGGVTIQDYLKDHKIDNCIYHGPLDHSRLSELLKSMDLMFFPSRSEGFPKVMLETACAGVPTLCYSDYGASEWIDSGRNGFVVDTYSQAKDVIQDLIDNPEKLESVSAAAIELGKSFDWKIVVKSWEKEIEKIAREK